MPAIPAVGGGSGGVADKKVSAAIKYPTLRVHRPVLAAISDYFGALLAPHPIEEDVHVTLDGTPVQVARVICEFAYRGEVKIAKGIVKDVCDAAERLQIKFLKDSFVKISDKDYAAYKAGKKPLPQKVGGKTGQQLPLQQPVASPPPPTTVSAAAASTAATGKGGAKGAGKTKADDGKSSSDTDSADSDDQGGRTFENKKAAAKGNLALFVNTNKKGNFDCYLVPCLPRSPDIFKLHFCDFC